MSLYNQEPTTVRSYAWKVKVKPAPQIPLSSLLVSSLSKYPLLHPKAHWTKPTWLLPTRQSYLLHLIPEASPTKFTSPALTRPLTHLASIVSQRHPVYPASTI